MIVEFIGCPSSGKTTIAATLFARIKEAELPAEFLVEQARSFIVEMKLLRQTQSLVLDDKDQTEICSRQLKMERGFSHVCPPQTILVCDSSPLNSLLYMGSVDPEFQKSLMFDHRMLKPLVFKCGYVNFNPLVQDTNRIHSQDQIRGIDQKVDAMIEALGVEVITLTGSLDSKVAKAFESVMSRVLE